MSSSEKKLVSEVLKANPYLQSSPCLLPSDKLEEKTAGLAVSLAGTAPVRR